MGNSFLRQIVLPFVIVATGLLAVYSLSGFIEKRHPKLSEDFVDSDLSLDGARLKGFVFGMEGLLADWYWVRSLQYIGDKMIAQEDANVDIEDLTSLNPRLLYPLLDAATDLDPRFIEAYSYGAIVLPAIDKDKAVALAAKGITNNPDKWRLYQYLGFIYWKLGEYEKASETYQTGAEIAGSPSFMHLMAASMKAEGGSRATARTIYRQMLTDSAEESIRLTAERRLVQLDWFDERDAINEVLANFKERNGRCSNSFAEVAAALFQVRLPEGRPFSIDANKRLVDPGGTPYKLDRENCSVTLDHEKSIVPPEIPGKKREQS